MLETTLMNGPLNIFFMIVRISDDRRLWSVTAPSVIRHQSFEIRLHGGRERRHRTFEVARNQGLGTRRCQIFPRKTGQHRIFGLRTKNTRFLD